MRMGSPAASAFSRLIAIGDTWQPHFTSLRRKAVLGRTCPYDRSSIQCTKAFKLQPPGDSCAELLKGSLSSIPHAAASEGIASEVRRVAWISVHEKLSNDQPLREKAMSWPAPTINKEQTVHMMGIC